MATAATTHKTSHQRAPLEGTKSKRKGAVKPKATSKRKAGGRVPVESVKTRNGVEWDRDKAIKALQAFAKTEGHAPSVEEIWPATRLKRAERSTDKAEAKTLKAQAKRMAAAVEKGEYPNGSVVVSLFGTFGKGLKEAGLEKTKR